MPIDPKVEQFFADAGMHVEKMIARKHDNGYRSLTDGQIMAGAEALYHQIKGGRKVKRIQYATKVWQLAKGMQGKAYDDDIELIFRAKEQIGALKRIVKEQSLKKLDARWKRKRDNIFWLMALFVASVSYFAGWFNDVSEFMETLLR